MSELGSTASSSCSSLLRAANDDGDCGEFEVAKVLAKLGNAAGREIDDSGGESVDCNGNNWGSKGKRSTKRVKVESADTDHPLSSGLGSGLHLSLGLGLSSSVPLPFDLNVDQAALYQEECDDRFASVGVKFVDVCESVKAGPTTCPPQSGGRSRQNLTEAEKEARKIRRILANRESARQTIRRRQAQYEELTQKAANLTSENEYLKRNKEMTLKEFHSLQITNQNLNEQVSHLLEEDCGEAKQSSDCIIDTHNLLSANWPFVICNTPSSGNPFPLPSCMQLSAQLNLCQLSRTSTGPFHEKGNAQNSPGWCIFPCPWFLPLPNSVVKNCSDDHQAWVDAQNAPSPSSIIPRLVNRSWVLPANEKVETKGAQLRTSPNGGACNEGLQTDTVIKVSKKKVDASVGAEARKRRRELMKLRSLHCHTIKAGHH